MTQCQAPALPEASLAGVPSVEVVTIRRLTGDDITLKVDATDTILNLRRRTAAYLDLSVHCVKLVSGTTVVPDDRDAADFSWSQCGVEPQPGLLLEALGARKCRLDSDDTPSTVASDGGRSARTASEDSLMQLTLALTQPRLAVSGSSAGDVMIWDLDNLRALKRVPEAHAGSVYSVYVDVMRALAVTGGNDGFVNVWDLDDFRSVAKFSTSGCAVYAVQANFTRGLVLAAGALFAGIWRQQEPGVDSKYVPLLKCTLPDTAYCAAADLAGSFQWTRDSEGNQRNECEVVTFLVGGRFGLQSSNVIIPTATATSPFGEDNFAYEEEIGRSGDSQVSCEEIGTRTSLWSRHTQCIDVDFPSQRAASGHSNPSCELRVWDLRLRTCLLKFEGHTGCIRGIRVDWEEQLAVSCGYDGCLQTWDLTNGTAVGRLTSKTSGGFNGVKLDVQGWGIGNAFAVTVGNDHSVVIWDIEKMQEQAVLGSHPSDCWCVA